jgi:hypothetical protein
VVVEVKEVEAAAAVAKEVAAVAAVALKVALEGP